MHLREGSSNYLFVNNPAIRKAKCEDGGWLYGGNIFSVETQPMAGVENLLEAGIIDKQGNVIDPEELEEEIKSHTKWCVSNSSVVDTRAMLCYLEQEDNDEMTDAYCDHIMSIYVAQAIWKKYHSEASNYRQNGSCIDYEALPAKEYEKYRAKQVDMIEDIMNHIDIDNLFPHVDDHKSKDDKVKVKDERYMYTLYDATDNLMYQYQEQDDLLRGRLPKRGGDLRELDRVSDKFRAKIQSRLFDRERQKKIFSTVKEYYAKTRKIYQESSITDLWNDCVLHAVTGEMTRGDCAKLFLPLVMHSRKKFCQKAIVSGEDKLAKIHIETCFKEVEELSKLLSVNGKKSRLSVILHHAMKTKIVFIILQKVCSGFYY